MIVSCLLKHLTGKIQLKNVTRRFDVSNIIIKNEVDVKFQSLQNEILRMKFICVLPTAHVRYIKILTCLRGFRVQVTLFSRLHCLAIPRRDLSTKKTTPCIEKWPERLRVMLELGHCCKIWNTIFLGSHKKLSLALLYITNYIYSPWKVKKNVILLKLLWNKVFVLWKLKLLSFLKQESDRFFFRLYIEYTLHC